MATFYIIFPLICVVSCGYGCARRQFLSRLQIEGVSRLTFSLIMPVYLFIHMATADLSSVFDIRLFLSFYLPVISVYALATLWHYFFDRQRSKDLAAAAVFALGACYSNMVLVGMPIAIAALGPQVIGPTFLLISFHSLVTFGPTIFLAALGTSQAVKPLAIVKTIAANPLIASIWLGVFANAIALPIAPFIEQTLRLFAQPGLTLALFVLGTSLHFYTIKGEVSRIAMVTTIKLLLIPGLVWGAGTWVFQLDPALVQITVLLAASPTGINAYLVASQQKCHEALVASSVVCSTFLSVFSFSFWLWLLL